MQMDVPKASGTHSTREKARGEVSHDAKVFSSMHPARVAQLQALAAPKDFTLTLQALLAEMHQLSPLPEPSLPLVKDWAEDPYGGGWHFWRPGINVAVTLPLVRQPIESMPVYICGESYTNQQGWVEGALTSAEHVLQKYFKLRTPAWLQPQNYFMGP